MRVLIRLLALTGFSLGLTLCPAFSAQRQWVIQLPRERYDYFNTPASLGRDGTIYIGTHMGSLRAFLPNGTQKWTCDLGGGVHTRPALAPDGTIYVGAYRRILGAVSPYGKLKWEFPAEVCEKGAATVSGEGTLYFHASLFRDRSRLDRDFNLFALRPDGTEKWRVALGGSVQAAHPMVDANGDIYVRSGRGRLFAVSRTGEVKWVFEGAETDPVPGAGGRLLLGCTNGTLTALDREGRVRWSVPIRAGVGCAPAVAPDGTIYVGSRGGWVFAFNPGGERIWTFETEGGPGLIDWPGTSPSSGEDWIRQTREFLKDHPHREITQPPIVDSAGEVIFAGGQFYLYALTHNGGLAWKADTGGYVTEPLALSPTGVIYYVCMERGEPYARSLIALRTANASPPGAK